MKNNRNCTILPAILIVPMMLLFFGCSEKIVNTESGGTLQKVSLKVASPDNADAVGFTLLTVTGPDIETPLVDTLAELGGYLVGEITVPEGRDRRFVMEIFSSPVGNMGEGPLIYRGETYADVVPGAVTKVAINLIPVYPMVRFSPYFTRVGTYSQFALDLKVNHLDSLSSLYLIMNGSSYNIYIDSIIPGSAVKNSVFSSAHEGSWARIEINQNVDMLPPPIVDGDGNATLATIIFQTSGMSDSAALADTSNFSITSADMRKANGDAITTYHVAPSMVEMYPLAQ